MSFALSFLAMPRKIHSQLNRCFRVGGPNPCKAHELKVETPCTFQTRPCRPRALQCRQKAVLLVGLDLSAGLFDVWANLEGTSRILRNGAKPLRQLPS